MLKKPQLRKEGPGVGPPRPSDWNKTPKVATPKPGFKTSEFFLTFATMIASGLFLFGIVSADVDKESLIEGIQSTLQVLGVVGGQIVIILKYMESRKAAKTQAVEKQTELDIVQINRPLPTPIRRTRRKRTHERSRRPTTI